MTPSTNLNDSIGLFIRAYHTQTQMMSDCVSAMMTLIIDGYDIIDSINAAIIECFPDGKVAPHNPIHQLVVVTLRDLGEVVSLIGIFQATMAYKSSVESAVSSFEQSPSWLSQKSVYSYLDKAENRQYNYSVLSKDKSLPIDEQASINQYIRESLDHINLG